MPNFSVNFFINFQRRWTFHEYQISHQCLGPWKPGIFDLLLIKWSLINLDFRFTFYFFMLIFLPSIINSFFNQIIKLINCITCLCKDHFFKIYFIRNNDWQRIKSTRNQGCLGINRFWGSTDSEGTDWEWVESCKSKKLEISPSICIKFQSIINWKES